MKISSSLIYYKDHNKVYNLVLKKDFESFEKAFEIIENEIHEGVNRFKEDAEFYPEKNLSFWYFSPKYDVVSVIASIFSRKEPNKIFVFLSDLDKDFIKISSRCQEGKIHLGDLLQKCIEGFENAKAGGHPQAAAGTFLKKDLTKFKERLLENL